MLRNIRLKSAPLPLRLLTGHQAALIVELLIAKKHAGSVAIPYNAVIAST